MKNRRAHTTLRRTRPTRAGGLVEPLEGRRLFAAVADEGVLPLVLASDRLVSEAQGQVVFQVTVEPGDQPVSLDYATVAGTAADFDDFAPTSGTLEFPAGADPRTAEVTVPLADDAFWEESEWFYLQLSNVAGAALPGDATTYRATATVRDDDPRPALRVGDAAAPEGDAGDVDMTFAVSLSAPHNQPIAVDYVTANGSATAPSDYAPASGTLVFDPGETTNTVTVAVHGDTADEPDENFTLVLRSPTIATILDGRGVGTIDEDDDHPPTVNVVDVSPDPRTTPVDSVSVVFSEPVIGVDVRDFTLTRDGGANLLTDAQTVETADGGTTWTVSGLAPLTGTAGQHRLSLNSGGSGIADAAGNRLPSGANDTWRTYATVAGRHVFYNNSFFDGSDPAANSADDAAVAPDKQALLPGRSAAFANVTGYARGINGVMVDVAGLPPGVSLTAADFTCQVAAGGNAATWSDGPAPTSVTVRQGAGADGSDRVTLVFADGTIQNAWLRVTVLANARTGLAAPDVFSFGNLVGDAGDRPAPAGGLARFSVGARDLLATLRRGAPGSVLTPLTDPCDFNRDGRVNALDLALARARLFRSLAPLA